MPGRSTPRSGILGLGLILTVSCAFIGAAHGVHTPHDMPSLYLVFLGALGGHTRRRLIGARNAVPDSPSSGLMPMRRRGSVGSVMTIVSPAKVKETWKALGLATTIQAR